MGAAWFWVLGFERGSTKEVKLWVSATVWAGVAAVYCSSSAMASVNRAYVSSFSSAPIFDSN
jgi:hypothetical protein